jgi:hypothetical protein
LDAHRSTCWLETCAEKLALDQVRRVIVSVPRLRVVEQEHYAYVPLASRAT